MSYVKLLTRCLAIIALICAPTLHGAMYDFVPTCPTKLDERSRDDECMPESRTVKLFDLDANKDVTYLILQHLVGFEWDLDDIPMTRSNLKRAYQNYLPLLLVSKKMRAMIFVDYKPLTLSRWQYWSTKIAGLVHETLYCGCTYDGVTVRWPNHKIRRLQKQLSLLNFTAIADNRRLVQKGTTTPLHMAIFFAHEFGWVGSNEFFTKVLDAETKKLLKKPDNILDYIGARKQLLNRRDNGGNTVYHTVYRPSLHSEITSILGYIVGAYPFEWLNGWHDTMQSHIIPPLPYQEMMASKEFAPQLYKDIESEYISPQTLRKHLEEAEWPNGYANNKGQVPGGLSPFLSACFKGNLDKINVFIEVAKDRPEINLNAQDDEGNTAINMLINRMKDSDSTIQHNAFAVINFLLDALRDGAAIDLPIQNNDGDTPLHNAASLWPDQVAPDLFSLVGRMIEVVGPQSSVFYAKNREGLTPLQCAVLRLSVQKPSGLVPFLKALQKGYDIALNERSSNKPGITAVHLAVLFTAQTMKKHSLYPDQDPAIARQVKVIDVGTQAIRLLIDAGADVSIKDSAGKTVYDYAKGCPEIYALLPCLHQEESKEPA